MGRVRAPIEPVGGSRASPSKGGCTPPPGWVVGATPRIKSARGGATPERVFGPPGTPAPRPQAPGGVGSPPTKISKRGARTPPPTLYPLHTRAFRENGRGGAILGA
jgi:hypothetical protein